MANKERPELPFQVRSRSSWSFRVRRVRTHLRGEAFDEHGLDTCLFSLIRLFIVHYP